MTDIVERLRFFATQTIIASPGYMTDAADEIERLRQQLATAIQDIEDWAGYASEYFQKKHDLAGCLAEHRAMLARTANHSTASSDK